MKELSRGQLLPFSLSIPRYLSGKLPFRKFCALFLTGAALALAPAISQAALVFDNYSNYESGNPAANVAATGSTPNTFMGDAYTLLPGTTSITGFDIFPANLSGTTYVGLKLNIFVWGSVNMSTVSAATPAFGNLLSSYTLTSSGSFPSGSFFPFESATPGVTPGISLTTPLSIPSTTIGITFNYQGTTDGVTYNNVNSLTSLIGYGLPPTVGSQVFSGYYRNANSEVNGNFTSSLRTLGNANESLVLRVYGTVVPEPSSFALLGFASAALLVFRRRK